MICLGVETSCDETAVALVSDGVLLGQRLISQDEAHALFGGVVPELASREHLRKAYALVSGLLADTGVTARDLDVVAVARGPGLLGSLLVGVNLAKGLALGGGARLVGVNHLHAHLMAAGLERPLPLPALGLLVSGGHTHLYRMAGAMEFELLGTTLDDAAGEALDKAAKAVNLPYPGGRELDLLGRGVEPDRSMFPVPYVQNDNLDFSFSGLKTAVIKHVRSHPDLRLETLPDARAMATPELARFCASVNHAVVEALRVKTRRALQRFPQLKTLVVAGGVAANSMLRRSMAELADALAVELVLPSPALCTDNASMIAFLGERLARQGCRHGLDMEAIPRGRAVPRDYILDPAI
ncbi:tRNA (adenosine(37)-N6)-threonylcarbamoyltransferase complex transferase subunit TsaD [Fundidesulfovibrio butyratiphilus]